jgi:phosphoglycolate phosphatase-like HAD superfamily hydrolase
VFGRITPAQKERLVDALRSRGRYVAMIGDGVNDIKAGLAAGVHTCAVTYGFSQKTKIVELNPEYIVDKIQDIFAIIN